MATRNRQPKKKQQTLYPADEDTFKRIGGEIMKNDPMGKAEKEFNKSWLCFFGVSPGVVALVWLLLAVPVTPEDEDLQGAEPKHLLWAIMWLKLYGYEKEMGSLCGGVNEQTFRKWVEVFVIRLSFLVADVIVWENRKQGDALNDCLVSVDGTDCHIQFQKACPKAFWSHKFKGPGLRYELAVCILTGCIVWINGPFPCGDWPDIVIFRFGLADMLEENERVEADDGYRGEDPLLVKVPKSQVHDQSDEQLKQRSYVRRRHETANKRIKQFKCMDTTFRHPIEFHSSCFRACAVLTQLQFEENPLFAVDYADP